MEVIAVIFIFKKLVIHPVKAERTSFDAVAVTPDRRTEMRPVDLIGRSFVITQGNIRQLTVLIRNLNTLEYRSEINYRDAGSLTVCNCIGTHISAVTVSSKQTALYFHIFLSCLRLQHRCCRKYRISSRIFYRISAAPGLLLQILFILPHKIERVMNMTLWSPGMPFL